MFDLQRFADEEIVESTENTEETAPEVAETPDEPSEQDEAIPEELGGLDESIAREVMEEAKGNTEPEPENKPEKGEPSPIPYARFKQKVDEANAKDGEIAKLKSELEAMRNQRAQVPQQPQSPPQQEPEKPQFQQSQFALTQENINIINNAIKEEAMRMSQLSQEDIDSIEFMEDDDPRKQKWQYAQEFAKGNVFEKIRLAQAAQQEEARRFLAQHQASIEDYNAFANKEAAEPDFAEISQFATGDYFNSVSPAAQPVIRDAWARITQKVASPQDIFLIKGYYTQAKAAYRAKHPMTITEKPKTTKFEQAKKFPRSQQIDGAGDSAGGVTESQLRQMLDEMPWDKIPEKYQKMLLGM